MRDNSNVQNPGIETTAVAEWKSWLTSISVGYLLFETLTGLAIWLLPFGQLAQFSVLLHTVIGLTFLLPVIWYMVRHWWVRRKGNLSHYQLLGYIAAALTAICFVSGAVVTYQGVVGPRMDYVWDLVHLATGIGLALFVVVHVVTVVLRKVNQADARRQLVTARTAFYVRSLVSCVSLLGLYGVWMLVYSIPAQDRSFPDDYNWRFGEDRPFAPSLASIDHSQWTSSVERQVVAAVGEKHRDVVLTSLADNADATQGLFDKVRACIATTDLDDDQQRQLEQALIDGATKMKQSGALQAVF